MTDSALKEHLLSNFTEQNYQPEPFGDPDVRVLRSEPLACAFDIINDPIFVSVIVGRSLNRTTAVVTLADDDVLELENEELIALVAALVRAGLTLSAIERGELP